MLDKSNKIKKQLNLFKDYIFNKFNIDIDYSFYFYNDLNILAINFILLDNELIKYKLQNINLEKEYRLRYYDYSYKIYVTINNLS